MQNKNYEELKLIDINTTMNLLTYIENHVNIPDILDELDFSYPYFLEDNNRTAFNLWLSCDYTTNDGNTFIDMFLEDQGNSLNNQSKDILLQRKDSYVSLFEVLNYKDGYMEIKDVLKNIDYKLKEDQLYRIVDEGEFILSRIGYIGPYLNFIGDISYLPSLARPMFMDLVLTELNELRKTYNSLTINDYLKKYSLNLYRIYNDCIINTMEFGDDITSYLYEELDEFEAYLYNNVGNHLIKSHISNLIDFFEYYLADEDMTLHHINQLDLEYFFDVAIKDGFISSQESLNSYINTLKTYVSYLNKVRTEYEESYLELLEISNNRFHYMNKIKTSTIPFNIDRGLASIISLNINESALMFLMEYDRFILYTVDKPLELTAKKRFIKRSHLMEIDNILDMNESLRENNPNQKDFPLVHLFYHVSLHLGLLIENGNYLTLTKKGTTYLRLKDEEKLALFFQYLWSKDFIRDILENDSIIIIEEMKNKLVDLLLSLEENKAYEVASIMPVFSNSDYFFHYYNYLEFLGMINTNLYPNYELSITKFGKSILRYLYNIRQEKQESSIIDLDSYRKSK